jgi:hypothetical protein
MPKREQINHLSSLNTKERIQSVMRHACKLLLLTLCSGTLYKDDQLLEFAALGSYCQFDLFGNECSLYQINPTADMPSDAQRIDKILQLIEEERSDRILVAHDIHTKHRLVSAICMVFSVTLLLQEF